MIKLRTKIILPLFILILIVFASLGYLLSQLFENFYISTFEERLEKEANLIGLVINNRNHVDESKLNFHEIENSLNANITVILPDGQIYKKNNQFSLTEIYSEIPKLEQLVNEKKTAFKRFHVINEYNGLFHYIMPLQNNEKFEGYLVLSLSVEPLYNTNQKLLGLLILSFSIACILILMVATKITEQYMRPIESATMVANELAKGNFKARTYEDRMDETGMLSQSINILARNLQQITAAQEMQQDRLQTLIESMGSGLILIDGKGYINLVNKYYKDIFDIDADKYLTRIYYEAIEHKEIVELVEQIFMREKAVRKQLQLPLKIERRHFEVYGAPIIGTNEEWKGVVLVFHDITELKKLEQMRKDFVANVSHELKTPMTSIKGFSETLLDGAMEDKQLREYFLNIILMETDRLQSLINDLLDLSNIEQESFKLNITEVNLKTILDEVTIILRSKADEKQIILQNQVVGDNLVVEGDLYRLKQIFINLINNALNYTINGGTVTIECVNASEKIIVSVADTGIGISKDQIPRIFERFYRVDKARSRNSGGTGLGLAIVKHLVEAHNGKIIVKSELNKGTTFSVILPKKQINK